LSENGIILYPNPGSEEIYISLNRNTLSINYQINDINGRLLIDKRVKNVSILKLNVKNWNPGLYFIKLTEDNRTMHTKFLVK
jgi:hypothetical protein